MKKLFTVITMTTSLALLTLLALNVQENCYASDSYIEVYPNDDPALAVYNVQHAVDNYEIVLLKAGVFNFGEEGSVVIDEDVEILGETDNEGNPLTRIMGGHLTFYSPLPNPLLSGPSITIQGINFSFAKASPIQVGYCRAAKITGNTIDNVIPIEAVLVPEDNPAGIPPGQYYRSAGIDIGTRTESGFYIEGAVTGNIEISGNVIDMHTGDFDAQFVIGQGARIVYANDITARISGNKVTNASKSGLSVLDVQSTAGQSSKVFFEDNTVITPAVGALYPTASGPNGMLAGCFYMPTDPDTQYIFSHNYIELHGQNLPGPGMNSYGIAGLTNDAIIKRNHIVVSGRLTNRGILALGSRLLVSQNKIEGEGAFAVLVARFGDRLANDNVLLANNYDNFTGGAAVFFLNASDNTLVGGTGIVVISGGTGNVVKGDFNIENTDGGVGEQISEELRQWGQDSL